MRALEPANDHVMVLLAKYHLMIDDPDAAMALVAELRELGTTLDVLEAIEIEALYQKRQWHEFREKLSGVVMNRFYDPQLLNLSGFWVGSHSGAARAEPVESKFNVLGSS